MDLHQANVLNLPRDMVHLWYCSFEFNKPKLSEYLFLLSKDEKTKAEKFKFDVDRERYVISRGVLRILLGKYLNCSSKDINFDYTSYGKPILSTETSLNFNISHSGDVGVFDFVNHLEIGVDVEQIKTDFDAMELARQFFSKHEIKALERIPEKRLNRAFYRCWTRKESFIKAEGSGLSFPLDKFTVSIDEDDQAHLLETDWDELEKSNWNLFSFVPQENYMVAICVRNKNMAIQYLNWNEIQI